MASSKKKKADAILNVPVRGEQAKENQKLSEKVKGVTNPQLQEETSFWFASILCALLVYAVVAYVILSVYHPDIQPLLVAAGKLSFSGDARPEPVEALLFRSGLVTITGGIFLFYYLFSRMQAMKKLAASQVFVVLTLLCIAAIAVMIYKDFAAPNPFAQGGGDQPQNSRDLVAKTNFDFFFDGLFLGSNLLLYTFIFVPAIACLFYFGLRKYKWDVAPSYKKGLTYFGYAVAAGLILSIVLMNTFEFPYTFENKYDFNAVYYSMTQVFAGVPMLVNGFSNTYGLYPHFLNPLFQLTGLSVYSFSLVMSLLAGLAFTFNFLFLRRFVANKILLVLGFCTIIFLPYLDIKFLTPYDCSFATFPIRYIIPSTLVFLAALYLRKRSSLLYWTIAAIMGFSALWNPEIGMVSFISWIVFNIYIDFFTAAGKVDIKKIAFHLVANIVVVALAVIIFKSIFYIVYGTSADLSLLFGYVLIFGKVGIGLLPMKPIHPWNIDALIVILGLTYSIVKWHKKAIDARAGITFLLSVIATGFLVYFQGRSHNWPFASSLGFCLMLLVILGDELWTCIKDSNFLPLHALFVVFLFLLSFSFFEIMLNTTKIKELVYQEDDKDKQQQEQTVIEKHTEFINRHSKPKEDILILSASQYEGLYFDGNKRRSAFDPGYEEMFMHSNVTAMENTILNASATIFIEPTLFSQPFAVRPLAAMAAAYTFDTADQTMYLLRKRKTPIPGTSVLDKGNDIVLHAKYASDTNGGRQRINDALGIKPVAMSSAFSVEVVFYSGRQIYPYATLVGNMNDTSGFIMANIINTPNYFFGINGKGVSVPMPAGQWVYCVMNVYPDHLEIYQDGALAGSMALTAPIKQSPEKLSIGNMGYLRYFLGAISEVTVRSRPMDKNQIAATWQQVSKGS